MAPRFCLLVRQVRLALAIAFGLAAGTSPLWVQPSVAVAQDDDFDDDWDDEEDDGDGDGAFFEEEEEDEEDYEQPPRWAGGMFTKQTWPQAFVERNLILIGGMTQVRGGLDIDMSDRTAFEIWRGIAELRYGVSDTFEIHGGANFVLTGEIGELTSSGPYNALFFLGFESAIAFEVVNFRLTTELKYIDLDDSSIGFDIGVGFPFRFRYKDKFAIYALERLMTIQTSDSAANGPGENSSKPDFNLGFSVAFQAVKELAVIGGAQINVADFNFKDNSVYIPARIGVLFAPRNDIDLGLQFSFLNLKPIDPNPEDDVEPAFYDQRSLLLYAQLRL